MQVFAGEGSDSREALDRGSGLAVDHQNENGGDLWAPESSPRGATIAYTNATSWWDEDYAFRREIEFEESLDLSRNQPVQLALTFANGRCFEDTIRIVSYGGTSDQWTAIPKQLSNTVNWPATQFIQSTSVTFVILDSPVVTNFSYYLYYDNNTRGVDPVSTASVTNFYSTKAGDVVSVKTSEYACEFQVGSGFSTFQDNDTNVVSPANYHSPRSLAPGMDVIDSYLAAYWQFEGDASDTSRNAWESDDFGGIEYSSDGVFGKCATFDGVTDKIAIDAEARADLYLQSPEGVTATAWFKTQHDGNYIISWDRSAFFRVNLQGGGYVNFASQAGNETTGTDVEDLLGNTGNLHDGTWHHVAITYEPETGIKRIYIDGDLDAERVPTGNCEGATDGHPPGACLGDYREVTEDLRYGFLGVGSEAEWYRGTTGPNEFWNGSLDDVRIYTRVLNESEVERVMSRGTSTIASITEDATGPVFARYTVTWENAPNANPELAIVDTCTFYHALDYWHVQRAFDWDSRKMPPDNSFNVLNTMYVDQDDDFNYFHYNEAGNSLPVSSLDFTAENYLVLYDTGSRQHVSLGLFVTGLSKEFGEATFTNLKWRVERDARTYNFVPGNETDLDTSLSKSKVYVDLWEYIDIDVQGEVGTHFARIHQGLTNFLPHEVHPEEEVFFNLELQVLDATGPAAGISVAVHDRDTGAWLKSAPTDATGNVTLDRLAANNYTLKLSYEEPTYVNPLVLGEFDVALNDSQTAASNFKYAVHTINMTKLSLHFYQLESYPENPYPCAGANISLYEDTGTTKTYIGYEIADLTGVVEVRWENFSQNEKNLTVKCNFLLQDRQINATGTLPGDFVSFPLEQAAHDVTVGIGDFFTEVSIDTTNQITWGDAFAVVITYTFTVGGGTAQAIEGAQVSYHLKNATSTLATGTMSVTNGSGSSSLLLDSANADLKLSGGGSYTIEITAQKAGFSPDTDSRVFSIDTIPTTLVTHQNQINAYWDEPVELLVNYNDTYNDLSNTGISGATVTYTVLQNESVWGVMSARAGGGYATTLDTTQLSAGSYTVRVDAGKDNYTSQVAYVELGVQEIYTKLNDSILCVNSSDVFYGESVTFLYNYSKRVGSLAIPGFTGLAGIDTATYEWEKTGTSEGGFGELVMVLGSPGMYQLDFATATREMGQYSIILQFQHANHVARSAFLVINIVERSSSVNGCAPTVDAYRLNTSCSLYKTIGQNFSFTFRDALNNQPISSANATFSWRQYSLNTSDPTVLASGAGTLVETANGTYTLDFDTETRAEGIYDVAVRLEKIHFESKRAELRLVIAPIPVTVNWSSELASDYPALAIPRGTVLQLQVTLRDPIHANLPLTGANVSLFLVTTRVNHNFEEVAPGSYQLSFSTQEYAAFVQNRVLSGYIQISKDNYEVTRKDVEITIKMQEILPDIPLFYFLIGMTVVVVVLVTLVAHKQIQQKRLPGIIKDIRATTRLIKKDKVVEKVVVSETKQAFLVDKFRDRWSALGFDMSGVFTTPENSDLARDIPSEENLPGEEEREKNDAAEEMKPPEKKKKKQGGDE